MAIFGYFWRFHYERPIRVSFSNKSHGYSWRLENPRPRGENPRPRVEKPRPRVEKPRPRGDRFRVQKITADFTVALNGGMRSQ
jgi:hypothetical protein